MWGAPQYDQFNSNGQSNGTYTKATNLNSYIDSNGQAAIPSLDITSTSQEEWFSVTVPSTTSKTFVATMQSTSLSSLSPKLYVFKFTSSLQFKGWATSTGLGATASVSLSGVQAGETYLVRALGNSDGSATGGFGLELNFGSVYQPPIAPPNTVVPQQPDQGGGGQGAAVGLLKIGNVTALGYMLSGNQPNIGSGVIYVPLNPLQLAVQTSVDQSSATDGSAALVAGTNLAQPQSIGGLVSLTATGSQNPSTLDSGSTPSVLQVVDYLIMNWNGQAGLLASTGWNASNGSLPGN